MSEYKNAEEEALPKMKFILENFGLQITLKVLIDSLNYLMEKRGKSIEALFVLEVLKGIHSGYCRRYEPEEDL